MGVENPSRGDARFIRPQFLPGVELVSVAYRGRSFRIHTHAEYVLGAVVGGAEVLNVGNQDHLADAGSTLFLHPHEPHSNFSMGRELLRYRVFYLLERTSSLPFRRVRRGADLFAERWLSGPLLRWSTPTPSWALIQGDSNRRWP